MTPHQFLGKLAALVPPPGFHMVRYAGVLSNAHRLRPKIVRASSEPEAPKQLTLPVVAAKPATTTTMLPTEAMPRRSWAWLLARVFAVDMTTCPCGGRLKLVQTVTDVEQIAVLLHGARGPPNALAPETIGGQLQLLR